MRVILAKTAGFCFGVRRAVNLAEEAAKKYDSCVTLGPIIHNKSVIDMLADKGVHDAGDIRLIKQGQPVIIRSHGIGKPEYEQLERLGADIIDATCPDVARIHEAVRLQSAEGRAIIIIGERQHPEVVAISQWCDEAYVFENPEEVMAWLSENEQNTWKPLAVVSQTTGTRENFELCVKTIKKECTNYIVFDTICNATFKRQREAAELSQNCDAVIVIGGRLSANSKHLADICRENCDKVYFIETADEISRDKLADVDILGITAGASTPAWIIKEVYHKMCDEIKVNEVSESEIPQSAIEEAEQIESFEEMLEKSIKTLYTGEKVTGIVSAITPTEVSVDLGAKQSGYIPVSELSNDPNVKVEDFVKIGDEIETYIVRVNDVEGTVMLSKKRLDTVKAWDTVDAARDNKAILEGTVVEENKGGIVVSVKGVRVFVPASQTGIPKDQPLTELMKKKVRLRITEVNQARRRVVGSIRSVMYDERRESAENVWNAIEEGKNYSGVVKSLTSYGAFIDIGGIDGMVHVSELSWNRVRQPSDVLKVGDKLEVYVISFDKEKKKISLGHKKLEENPWDKFTTQYSVGDVAAVKIVKLMPFGAFAEIISGVDGLIHISQIADRRIGKPDEVLTVGETVNVKITEIDNEKQKVSLSIRALLASENAKSPEVSSETDGEETAE